MKRFKFRGDVVDFDMIVVGAGVVGLAVARAAAKSGRAVLLLDGEADFGSWTSSRNSEVIHAGLYYPRESAKARLCVDGRERLYRYCLERGVPHRRTGKLVFAATDDQRDALVALHGTALANGVEDAILLDARDVGRLEPDLVSKGALLSPSTGIVDAHALMLAMLGDAEADGATFVPRSKVSSITRRGGDWIVQIEDHQDSRVSASTLVNSAGLHAQKVAAIIEELDPAFIPPLYLARGVYFSYSGRIPFSHLIYPLPEPGGLGLHLTLDLAGQARFGPDVEWIDDIGYAVDERRKPSFLAAARKIWRHIDPEKLQPGYAGIRPKLSAPGEAAADFVISGPGGHGCPGLVNLFGIESPGLTASLAIGTAVLEALDG
jgi:L-2-hydroxyglutarate oxidase LhgO